MKYTKGFARKGMRNRRASILMFATIMLTIAGSSVLLVTQSVTQNIRNIRRAEDRLQAFYIAESGIQHVVDWYNRPGTAPDISYFQPNAEDKWIDDSGNSIITDTLDVDTDSLPVLNLMAPSRSRGRVVELTVSPPRPPVNGEGGDPVGTVARVRSVGRTDSGVEATVEVVLYTNQIPLIGSPAGLVSRRGAASNGSFDVHWGEIWAQDDLTMVNNANKKFSSETDDPWFFARTVGHLRDHQNVEYADGTVQGGYSSTPIPEFDADGNPTPNYYIPYLESALKPGQTAAQWRDHENLLQHQTLEFPEYDYDAMKILFLQNGWPIYRTTADGMLITGTDSNGNDIIQSFSDVFSYLTGDDPDDLDPNAPSHLYFIDTIDGNRPAEDGSNLSTISMGGGGPFFQGYFFIGANVDMDGAGISPTFDCPEIPNGMTLCDPAHDDDLSNQFDSRQIDKCRLQGMFYSYGSSEMNGTGSVYGSYYSERGFQGGGTWDIYYDHRIHPDNLRNRVGSKLSVRLWNTY